jgi:hypothetical protein
MPLFRLLTAIRPFLCFVAFAACVHALRAAEYQPLTVIQQKPVEAAFQSADANGNWKFITKSDADGTQSSLQSVSAAETIAWGNFRDFKPGHRLRLASGGEIVGYQIEVDRDRVALESDLIDTIDLPLDAVTAIHFDPPRAVESDRESKIEAAEVGADQHVLLLANGDTLTGRLVSIQGAKVVFRVGDDHITLDRNRVAAVVTNFSSAKEPDATSVRTWVGLSDGSRALASSIETDGKQHKLTVSPGTIITVPTEAVVALQPLGGRAVYLSDLQPAGYRHVPFLELPWDYQFDRNVLGGPLDAGGKLHLKGIGMHSAARITYDLDGKYELFAADLAIDDATRGRGSVACRVFLDDGSGEWQLKYESPVVRGREQPVPMAIDVQSAKRISLLVDFADRVVEQDHLNWLNARVIK